MSLGLFPKQLLLEEKKEEEEESVFWIIHSDEDKRRSPWKSRLGSEPLPQSVRTAELICCMSADSQQSASPS